MSRPLDHVTDAAARLEAVRAELQEAVDDARTAGASWSDVGAALGTSRQAAFKRFGRPRDPRTGGTMSTRTVDHVPALVEEVFGLMEVGDYAALRARMPDDVAARLSEDVVLDTWSRVVSEVGNLEGFGPTTVEAVDGEAFGVVVGDTTLRCEAGELRGRVALDDRDRVVGFLVVPLDATDLAF